MSSQGLSLEAVGLLHSVTKGQVSQRLTGGRGAAKGFSIDISVTCHICGAVFLATRADALYCGATCRKRANRARKGA